MAKRRTNKDRHDQESNGAIKITPLFVIDKFSSEESKKRIERHIEDRKLRELRSEARKNKKLAYIDEMKERKKAVSSMPDPEESWALVEFYRQEHDELPPQSTSECKPMSIKAACKKVADKFKGPREGWVDPFNTMMMLSYGLKKVDPSKEVDEMQNIVDCIRKNEMEKTNPSKIAFAFAYLSVNYKGPYA